MIYIFIFFYYPITNIILFTLKIICELDPLFVAEHYHELEEHWILQDGYGNCHRLQFNNCITMLMLTEGWHEFRDFYHVTLNPLMSFTYLDNSHFQIKIFNGSTPKNEYPRYHRLTTCINRDLQFYLTVPDIYPMSNKLVWVFFFICYYFNSFLKLWIFNHKYLFIFLLSNLPISRFYNQILPAFSNLKTINISDYPDHQIL